MMCKIVWSGIGLLLTLTAYSGDHVLSVEGDKLLLNGEDFLSIGLRFSNSLITEAATEDLIGHLDIYKSYGLNTVSVFFMGSRFGDIKGYKRDGSLDLVYAARMARIIEACDERGMVVIVGCLYWGNSKGKWEDWTQREVNNAISNTVRWLSDHNYRNVIVDPDNEGMGHRKAGFDIGEMIAAGKMVDPNIIIGFNSRGKPSAMADIALHYSDKVPDKPYIQSEGAPLEYWREDGYSKETGLYDYINIGIYTPGKKNWQIKDTDDHLKNGMGYILASTWIQCVPPHHEPGGDGDPCDPGIKWWLDHIRDNYKNN